MLKSIIQNKHVMIVALALFIVSMSTLFFFMGPNSEFQKDFKTDVIHSTKEKTPEEQEKNYRDSLQNEKDSFVILDMEGKIVFTSKNFETEFGYEKEELKNHVFPSLLNTKDISTFLGAFSKVAQTHKPLMMVGPYNIHDKNGENHLSMGSIVAILEDQELSGIAVITKEITEPSPSEKVPEEEKKFFPRGKKILNEEDKEEHLMAKNN